MYWCAASSEDQPGELVVAKWQSIANHIQNIHTGHGKLFPRCQHDDLSAGRRKKWLKPSMFLKCLITVIHHLLSLIILKHTPNVYSFTLLDKRTYSFRYKSMREADRSGQQYEAVERCEETINSPPNIQPGSLSQLGLPICSKDAVLFIPGNACAVSKGKYRKSNNQFLQ